MTKPDLHPYIWLLERERQTRRLSYRAFGDLIGMSEYAVYSWVNLSREPKFCNLEQALTRLGYRLTIGVATYDPPQAEVVLPLKRGKNLHKLWKDQQEDRSVG